MASKLKCKHSGKSHFGLRQIVETEKCFQGGGGGGGGVGGALKCHSTKRAAQSVMHTMTRRGHAVIKCKFVEGIG